MDLNITISALIDNARAPFFLIYHPVATQELFAYYKKGVDFSTLDVINNESLDDFYKKLNSNRIKLSSEKRKSVSAILEGFDQKTTDGNSWLTHKNAQVYLAGCCPINYPDRGQLDWKVMIHNHLYQLKTFLEKLVKKDRTDFTIIRRFTTLPKNWRQISNTLEKFVDPEPNIANFKKLVLGTLGPNEWISWGGTLRELHYFIKEIVEHKIIEPGYCQEWLFTAAHFKLKGNSFSSDDVKYANRYKKDKLDKVKLDSMINNFLAS